MQGVYVLRHTPTGKLYVGSSHNLLKRKDIWWQILRVKNKYTPVWLRSLQYRVEDWEFKTVWEVESATDAELRQREAEVAAAIHDARPDLLLNQKFVSRPNRVGLTVNGVTTSVAEWSRKVGIKYHVVRSRLKSGWSPEQALGLAYRAPHTPSRNPVTLTRILDDNGRQITQKQAAAILGCHYGTLANRLRHRRVKYGDKEITIAELKALTKRFRVMSEPPLVEETFNEYVPPL